MCDSHFCVSKSVRYPFVVSAECHTWDSVINGNILCLLDWLCCSLDCLQCPRCLASSYQCVRLWH